MAKKWNVDRPRESAGKLSPCEQAGFTLAQCMRARAKIDAILRGMNEKRVDPEAVLNAMLPAITGQASIEFTERDVRAAVQKVLDAE